MSKHETLFAAVWPANYPPFVRQFRFDEWDGRKWMFDFAWPRWKVAVELFGGTFSRGGHARGLGIHNDCEKLRAAVYQGWRVVPFTDKDLREKSIELIQSEIKWLLDNVPETK